jgi:ACS family hexuronate transporter-like MFS transporter
MAGMTGLRVAALVVVATATMTVSYLDRQAMAAMAPKLTAELELDETTFGLLASAFSVAYLAGTPAAGLLVDRFGARRVLPAAVGAWSLVSAAHALAVGPWSLGALRLLLGAAESPSFPAAAQAVARALPPERREAATGVLFTGSSIGAAVAAALVPSLVAAWGWQAAFVGTTLVGLAWLPCWWLVTRDLPALDGPAARGPSGLAALVPLLRLRVTWRAIAAVVGSAPAIGLVLQWSAKLLVARHGVDPADVGRYLWAPPLAFDLGAVGFGAVAAAVTRRRGRAAPQRVPFALAAVLLLAIAGIGLGRTPWETTLVAALAIAGGGGVYTLTTADLLARVPADRVAAAGSLTAAAQSLALVLALPTIGRILDRTHDWRLVGVLLAALAAPASLVWLMADRPDPSSA